MLTKFNGGAQLNQTENQAGAESDTSSMIDERELHQKLSSILTMLEQRKPESGIEDEADFDDCAEVDESVPEDVFSQQLSQSALDEDSQADDLNLYAIQMHEVRNTDTDENIDTQLKNVFSQFTESQILE